MDNFQKICKIADAAMHFYPMQSDILQHFNIIYTIQKDKAQIILDWQGIYEQSRYGQGEVLQNKRPESRSICCLTTPVYIDPQAEDPITAFLDAYQQAQGELTHDLEKIIYQGDQAKGVIGFINDPNTTHKVSGTPFDKATPKQIYDEISKLVCSINSRTGVQGEIAIGYPENMGAMLESKMDFILAPNLDTIATLRDCLLRLTNVTKLIPVSPSYMRLAHGHLCWFVCSLDQRFVGLGLDKQKQDLARQFFEKWRAEDSEISPSALGITEEFCCEVMERVRDYRKNYPQEQQIFSEFIPNFYFGESSIPASFIGSMMIRTAGGITGVKGMFQTIDTQVPFTEPEN